MIFGDADKAGRNLPQSKDCKPWTSSSWRTFQICFWDV